MGGGTGGSRNIFLVGPMGSGKTAVGKRLARLLGMPFVDSDAEIERRTGVDIPLIFDKEGEAGFRARERDAIAELTAREGIVLSTGGGAVLLPENRGVLRERGTAVYLETSVAQQAARVRRDAHRPLVAGVADPAARLAELMAHRAPLYAEVAAVTVRTDRSQVAEVVRRVVEGLRAQGYDVPRSADRILAR
ncbi:MAG: shikimate kinase AroK [Gammaproteobacteria bacterium]|nr:shikimate kinase AroK [Gammaproteobacteria bacterium]